MKNKEIILDSILAQGMLPLFFYEDAGVSLDVIRTLYRAGVRVLEYTNRGKEALDNFQIISKAVKQEMPDLHLGIGTIKTEGEAERFVSAGADFIVSPTIDEGVARAAERHKMLYIPGCMSPTEISLAQRHKAALIKIFPANILGPAYISSIRDLFQGQLFMPTGGVEIEVGNISEWFRAGVCAVGMGSKLISKNVLDNKLYDELYANTIKALELVQLSK
ncbi:bifunctional 4-hydroxy-2-oxoglutarate aldolase/2-dehydro-3-deoxy-phosphogluconate aldolase [Mucilaginibacter sp.]|uniref:bifunctional 4-hydroxy-2-oxoglutarate aldolase/2-dehydro-3-deoxy-phosphogluconate aldolase n=1 Tax=Mucilaginibacter sp. TaxID=1882438 RepID=UPI0035BC8ECB